MRRALAFLTPFGSPMAPSSTTLCWFPAVGALLGLAVGLVWWLAAKEWTPLVVGAITIMADLVLTGYLHFDGLADAADGLLPPLSKERRLEAMADPAVGAFGVITVGAVLLLRFGAFASVAPKLLVLGGLWCASRTSMLAIVEMVPYARPEGLVKAFLSTRPRSLAERTMIRSSLGAGVLASAALVIVGDGAHGLLALGAELIVTSAVVLLSRRRIGGFTGDVLGAAAVLGETIGLVVLAAR